MGDDLEKIWSAFGLQPQAFPVFFPLGPRPFLDGTSTPSGAAGATVTLTRDLPNYPHMLIGLRLANVYAFEIEEDLEEASIQQFRTMHEWLDGEQLVRVDLAQQNPLAQPTMQSLLQGRGGWHWHPWPVPFPMAGGNNISITVTRVTGYPALAGHAVTPQLHAVLVAAQLRADLKTVPPHRVGP